MILLLLWSHVTSGRCTRNDIHSGSNKKKTLRFPGAVVDGSLTRPGGRQTRGVKFAVAKIRTGPRRSLFHGRSELAKRRDGGVRLRRSIAVERGQRSSHDVRDVIVGVGVSRRLQFGLWMMFQLLPADVRTTSFRYSINRYFVTDPIFEIENR